MAFVARYGNTISQNGWRMVDEAECEWIVPARTNVHLQIRKGDAATILGAFASRFDQTVEPLRDADSACWTPTNDVPTSNHMAGTACDFNWDSHPFHVEGTFGDRIPAVHALLDEFKGCVEWGGECWGGNPTDDMHFQLAHSEGDQRIIDLANELRARAPLPEEPHRDRYIRDIIAEGNRHGISERGIEIALATALVESNITMYANSNDDASLALPHDAVGSDHMSVGIFQQQDYPEWGPLECRMDAACSAGVFYDHLVGINLGDDDNPIDYNNPARSPGQFAQAVQRSAFPDRYDERMDEASALYYQFSHAAPAPGPEPAPPAPDSPRSDEMTPDQAAQLADIWHAMFDRQASKSRYGDPNIKWYPKDYWLNDDGLLYDLWVENNARLGDPEAIAQIRKAASSGDKIAARFLADLFTPTPTPPPVVTPPAPVPVVTPPAPLITPPPTPAQPNAGESPSIAAALTDFKADINRLIG